MDEEDGGCTITPARSQSLEEPLYYPQIQMKVFPRLHWFATPPLNQFHRRTSTPDEANSDEIRWRSIYGNVGRLLREAVV
ncbi:unnamed protein product [Caenorhabditis nigoni]